MMVVTPSAPESPRGGSLGQRRRHAFTLIELVTVIVVLGVLSVVATPMYMDYRTNARKAAEDAVVAGVRTAIRSAGIRTALTGAVTWPATLDSAAANSTASAANPFFSQVLSSPITGGWRKSTTVFRYVSESGTTYTYNPADGSFKAGVAAPPPASPVF